MNIIKYICAKIEYMINRKKFSILILWIFASLIVESQNVVNVNATSFALKIKQTPNAQIIDVRTPAEFMQSHIENAKNINISASDFPQKIENLNKDKAVFLYCLSGARSAAAMRYMSSLGFKEIYNLSGGLIQWRAGNLPETTNSTNEKQKKSEISVAQYQKIINSNKLVLVDFYAEWCAPCKKMKPYLDEISIKMKDKVEVVRIDADANKTLAQWLKVDALPVLYLYKGNKIVWSNKGYISKEDVLKKIHAYKF